MVIKTDTRKPKERRKERGQKIHDETKKERKDMGRTGGGEEEVEEEEKELGKESDERR